jgi:glycyl-tRNA synthetase beta chain
MAKKKSIKPAKGESVLVELLTEELPPKSLKRLSDTFGAGVHDGLKEKYFLGEQSKVEIFATPRRLAVRVSAVAAKQRDRVVERKGPSIQAGVGADGKPTPALLGFARSCGTDVAKLERRKDDKGEYFLFSSRQKGEPLAAHLAGIVETALKKLPVAKLMRWGSGDAQFVRPVHGVILLHGGKVIPGVVLGLKSGNKTLGHRFLSEGWLTIKRAGDYEKVLAKQGEVIASFEQRSAMIVRELDKAAVKLGKGVAWRLGKEMDLVNEVASIVESPRVYVGAFDAAFLEVPRECLVVSMQQHQKYFPLADAQGKLLARFLFVSNMHPTDASQIIHGNERVLRARLSDAKFFFDQDRKTKLVERVTRLGGVVYHNKLGSQLERVQRIQKIALGVASLLHVDASSVERAAYLAKADLLTDMVGEFPELQGIMGRYYALHDGEPAVVADAIEQHYYPRVAGGALPQHAVAVCVALADKLDSLAGMFGIGQQPTGDKDPFGLRRAALGVVRIVMEKAVPLPSDKLVELALSAQPGNIPKMKTELLQFMQDRLRNYLREGGHTVQEIDTVLSAGALSLAEIPNVLEAVKKFQRLPEAADLAAANKRIVNIIKKAGTEKANADANVLAEPAERALYDAMQGLRPDVESKFQSRDYTGALQALARLKQPVDAFFDEVMVMVDDARVRDNRLALLGDLKALMNRVADISKLAA